MFSRTNRSLGVESEIKHLKQDLGRVRGDLYELASAIADRGRSTARHAQQSVERTASDSARAAREFVDDQPVTVALVAAAVGVVAGFWIGRATRW